MEKDEKLQTVPLLHMQGNALVKQRQFREAASKYKEAVLLLKTVQSKVSGWRIFRLSLGFSLMGRADSFFPTGKSVRALLGWGSG